MNTTRTAGDPQDAHVVRTARLRLPQAVFAGESLVSELIDKLGMDQMAVPQAERRARRRHPT